jgi:hypothetical protein
MKKFLFIAVLTIAYLLVPAGAEMRAQYTAPDSCFLIYQDIPSEITNPDSVAIDTCIYSTSFGHGYAKRWFIISFSQNFYIFNQVPIPKEIFVTVEDINNTYSAVKQSFLNLRNKYGNFYFKRIEYEESDSENIQNPGFWITFDTYSDIDSVTKDLNKIDSVKFALYRNRFAILTKILNEQELNNFNIYPLPANDIINIKSQNEFEKVKIEIKNILGESVYSENYQFTNNIQINISFLKTGIYFIKVNDWVEKFIKY